MADRPKRRKHKDNPYKLDYCKEIDTYIVIFKDVKGQIMNYQQKK